MYGDATARPVGKGPARTSKKTTKISIQRFRITWLVTLPSTMIQTGLRYRYTGLKAEQLVSNLWKMLLHKIRSLPLRVDIVIMKGLNSRSETVLKVVLEISWALILEPSIPSLLITRLKEIVTISHCLDSAKKYPILWMPYSS